jgi:hypothetical protein
VIKPNVCSRTYDRKLFESNSSVLGFTRDFFCINNGSWRKSSGTSDEAQHPQASVVQTTKEVHKGVVLNSVS